jgi:DNA-binding CsgD family transcriptional regulator
MSGASVTRDSSAGVIDERAVEAWLRRPGLGSPAAVDVPLCLTVLEMLLDVVDTSVFVVAAGGQVVVANARGISLLDRYGDVLRAFLHAATAEPSATDPKLASWSAGPFCGTRRWFSLGGRGRHALIFVEDAERSTEGVVERAAREWMLTARQEAVFRLVLDGHSNKEIGERLGMAARTVEAHITTLFDKTGVDSRARLIARTWEREETERLRSRVL